MADEQIIERIETFIGKSFINMHLAYTIQTTHCQFLFLKSEVFTFLMLWHYVYYYTVYFAYKMKYIR